MELHVSPLLLQYAQMVTINNRTHVLAKQELFVPVDILSMENSAQLHTTLCAQQDTISMDKNAVSLPLSLAPQVSL